MVFCIHERMCTFTLLAEYSINVRSYSLMSSLIFYQFSAYSICYTWIWGYMQEKGELLGLVFMICDGGEGTC